MNINELNQKIDELYNKAVVLIETNKNAKQICFEIETIKKDPSRWTEFAGADTTSASYMGNLLNRGLSLQSNEDLKNILETMEQKKLEFQKEMCENRNKFF